MIQICSLNINEINIDTKGFNTHKVVVVEVSSEDQLTLLLTHSQKIDRHDLVWAIRHALIEHWLPSHSKLSE